MALVSSIFPAFLFCVSFRGSDPVSRPPSGTIIARPKRDQWTTSFLISYFSPNLVLHLLSTSDEENAGKCNNGYILLTMHMSRNASCSQEYYPAECRGRDRNRFIVHRNHLEVKANHGNLASWMGNARWIGSTVGEH